MSDHTEKTFDKYIQRLTLHCLECKTRAYRVIQDVPVGSEAREGPVTTNDGWVEQDIITSRNGWIEVLLGPNGCLDGNDTIETYFRDLNTSDTFSIAIPSISSNFSTTLFSTPLHPLQAQDSDSANQYSAPLNTLNLSELPPLFPPPPFTPSHPVFQLLSSHAESRSAEWRIKAEELVRNFLKVQLEDLERRENQMRAEVEAAWKNYREAWKEIITEINESRLAHGEPSSKKPTNPISIRDFSPIVPHSPRLSDSIQPSSSPNIASFPISSPISTSFNRNRPVFSSLSSKGSSLNHLSARNEVSPVKDQVQLSSPGDRGELLMSAFKRNMDTDVDIATSLRWAEGEEALRKRFETKKEDHRARKRTSKSLDITSGNVPTQPEVDIETAIDQAEKSTVKPPEDQKKKKQKRRVTFDINSKNTSDTLPAVAMEELFDLDDLSSEKLLSPTNNDTEVTHTPAYKLHHNPNKVSQDMSPGSLPSFTNAFQPSLSLHAPISINGIKRRPDTFNISNTLPLLSSSVPANDWVIPTRNNSSLTSKISELPTLPENPSGDSGDSTDEQVPLGIHRNDTPIRQTPPIPPEATGELEIRNLFAASAPSHRHAWKEGGNAWNKFHQINGKSSNPDTPTTEDDPEELFNEPVSDNEDNWALSGQLARSLPIQIRPPPHYTRVLEFKTSLTDKQGILVPPLKFDKPKSSTAMRKAVYADRDLSRSVDPGPTLNMDEEIDEESPENPIDDQDRGRRHALSILQARSTVPEAGMWRSLAT
ncbi:hypothetical protein Clacol_001609 [Clathrus columnatus]|uniref:Uncharacterized protein n=1 Tax=Clathrus columnatus TaxID=1419009 RepID=A0AAV5A1V1_9AGAM|nr:hypothetical protein Clacol_001609 [Clathrus columnatus]